MSRIATSQTDTDFVPAMVLTSPACTIGADVGAINRNRQAARWLHLCATRFGPVVFGGLGSPQVQVLTDCEGMSANGSVRYRAVAKGQKLTEHLRRPSIGFRAAPLRQYVAQFR